MYLTKNQMYFSNVYDVVLHSENVTCTQKSVLQIGRNF